MTAFSLRETKQLATRGCSSRSESNVWVRSASREPDLPTRNEYESLDENNATDKILIRKYKMNQEMLAIIVLGQSTDHAMVSIDKTKDESNFPQGIAYMAWDDLVGSNRPSDMAAEIAIESELEDVKLNNAKEYYKECTSVASKSKVRVSDKTQLKIMAKKANNSTYCKIILDELEEASPNFEDCCDEISKVQRLQKTKSNGGDRSGKEVQLTNQERPFNGKCGKCGKWGHKKADCKSQGQGAGNKKCNHCGKQGHLEANCWRKNPSKAPEHIRKKIEAEASAASIETEIHVVSLEDFV